MPVSTSTNWQSELESAFKREAVVRAVLSNPAQPGGEIQKIIIRRVDIGGEPRLQWAERRGRQETHANLTHRESVSRLRREFPHSFRQFNLFTETADREFRAGPKGDVRLRQSKPTKTLDESPAHNVSKNYLIPEGRPCPFLEAAGVMTPDGRVRASMQHKFRQINRFLEFINDIYAELPSEGPLRVVDFGCGKSYLTFAVRHLLVEIHHREVEIIGIDRSEDVISTCRETTERLGLSGLSFQAGDITAAAVAGPVHLAVSLHACDTATDAAIAQAVAWESNVILAVPCCQHEVAAAMQSPALELIQSHGILKERFAALATDALRAAAMEAAGYRTQVIEFIDLDHTAKNLLIRGVRRPEATVQASAAWRERMTAFKTLLGVDQIAIESFPPWAQT